ncbi:unnamed protein product [Urochloa humidicola]
MAVAAAAPMTPLLCLPLPSMEYPVPLVRVFRSCISAPTPMPGCSISQQLQLPSHGLTDVPVRKMTPIYLLLSYTRARSIAGSLVEY